MTSTCLVALLTAGIFISPLQTEVPEEVPAVEVLLMKAHEAYYEKGHKEEALAYYIDAVNTAPDNADALNARGWFYLDLGTDFSEDALTDFEHMQELNENDARAYHGKGWALADLRRYTESIHAFATYSRLRPESPYGSDGMGWALAGLGQYQSARTAYQRAYFLDPDFGYFLETQAWCSLLMGEEKQAIKFAKRALRVEEIRKDNNHYAFILIALGYWKEQGYDVAQTVLELGLEQSARNEWGFSVLQYLAGQIDEKELARQATDEDQMTEAFTYIGIKALLNGDKTKADYFGQKVEEHGTPRVWEYYLAREWLGFIEPNREATTPDTTTAPDPTTAEEPATPSQSEDEDS